MVFTVNTTFSNNIFFPNQILASSFSAPIDAGLFPAEVVCAPMNIAAPQNETCSFPEAVPDFDAMLAEHMEFDILEAEFDEEVLTDLLAQESIQDSMAQFVVAPEVSSAIPNISESSTLSQNESTFLASLPTATDLKENDSTTTQADCIEQFPDIDMPPPENLFAHSLNHIHELTHTPFMAEKMPSLSAVPHCNVATAAPPTSQSDEVLLDHEILELPPNAFRKLIKNMPDLRVAELTAMRKERRKILNRKYQQQSRSRKAALITAAGEQQSTLQLFALQVRQLAHEHLSSDDADVCAFLVGLTELEQSHGVSLCA